MITFNSNELKFNDNGTMTPLPYFSNSTSAQLDARLTSAESSIATHTTDISATKSMISDAWSSSITYNVGDYCISGNTLYRCIAQNSNQQPPNATYWKSVSIAEELPRTDVLFTGTIQPSQTTTIPNFSSYKWVLIQGSANGGNFGTCTLQLNVQEILANLSNHKYEMVAFQSPTVYTALELSFESQTTIKTYTSAAASWGQLYITNIWGIK